MEDLEKEGATLEVRLGICGAPNTATPRFPD